MGCTYSGRSGSDEGVRSFKVHNVDDQGMELNRGIIKIIDNDLVLYQKGKEPIRWPLRCLRRYGCDEELFSFESGRRCAIGPGIYAFKCANAGELFNLVQESIHRAGEEDQRGQQVTHNSLHSATGVMNSNRQMVPPANDIPAQEHATHGMGLPSSVEHIRDGTIGRRDSSHLYINGIPVEDTGHDYVNSGTTRTISGAFQIDETAALVDFLHNPPGIMNKSNHSQVNYAELCMPDCHMSQASMENLLDETGQGALHNVERTLGGLDLRSRLSQHSLSIGGQVAESNRNSMPIDILAGASQQDSDSILHSTDSDVFLADVPPDGMACSNYVNIALEEGWAAAAPSVSQEIVLPPSYEINYVNFALHNNHREPRVNRQIVAFCTSVVPSVSVPFTSPYYAVHFNQSRRALPKIPCQPISYGDALRILRNLSGPVSPSSWHGTLPIDYRIGPSFENGTDLKVEITVNNYLDTRPVHNVIGVIHGREEPDRYVLLGNHHDAWVYGAVDPQSAGVALSHVVNLFGQLLKKGYRPRRTLVFCSWDAEEHGLIGSSEWVKDNFKVLYERSVAYLNADMAAQGNFTILASVSPLLQDALYEAAKQVPSPINEYKTLYDLWLARPLSSNGHESKEPRVGYSLGGGSDHAKFYNLAGIPCADFRIFFDPKKYPLSSYPLYHSQYDNLFMYENYQDPGFLYTKALTQFWAVLANNLAEASTLPLKTTRYSTAVSDFINEFLKRYREIWTKNNVNIDALLSAVHNFTNATEKFEHSLASETDLDKQPYKLRMYNDKMMQLERAFINSKGLPSRPQMKHIIFAPSIFDSYTDTFFPGISDTMYNINRGLDQWEQLKEQVFIATFFIQSAAQSLEDIGL